MYVRRKQDARHQCSREYSNGHPQSESHKNSRIIMAYIEGSRN